MVARSSTAKVRLFDDGSEQKYFCLDSFFLLVNPTLLHSPSGHCSIQNSEQTQE